MVWGAAAGTAGALGLVTLYHALATTRFSVVAPVTALVGAMVPVGYGLVIGERPEVLAWAGVALALPALLLITAGGGEDRASRVISRGAWLGALAGCLFALYSIFISRTVDASGLWPLVGARLTSVPLLVTLALGTGRPVRAPAPVLRIALVAGFLDMLSNIFLLLALHRGLVSLVILISSLYPAFTVVLARVVIQERITGRQLLGLLLAGAGVALISVA
jgi:drug/metabolite transporter (DMT)-like permease